MAVRDGLQVVCLRVAPEKQFGRHDRVQNVSTELRVDWTREKRISRLRERLGKANHASLVPRHHLTG
jgi:hypothetical protein